MRKFIASVLLSVLLAAAIACTGLSLSTPARAGFLDDILTGPKTLIERAIEARSSSDILTDNEIVIKINAIMVDLGTIQASTEIYEQRLLVTGLFDDEELYEEFRDRVEQVEDVRELFWHVRYMSEEDQEANEAEMLDWTDAVELDARVGFSLIETAGIADVNLRVAVDAFANVFVLGRARSDEELQKAIEVSSETEGVGGVINYIEMRP